MSNNNVSASSTQTIFSKVSQTIQLCKTVSCKFLEKETKLVTVSCEQFVSAPIFDETVISTTLLRRLHFSVRNFFFSSVSFSMYNGRSSVLVVSIIFVAFFVRIEGQDSETFRTFGHLEVGRSSCPTGSAGSFATFGFLAFILTILNTIINLCKKITITKQNVTFLKYFIQKSFKH